MDIVTHGMMGVVLASPIAPTHPVAASCFMLGSVLPDLDALSRVFGRRAFLAAHQTYSHSVPIILALGAALWAALRLAGVDAPLAPAALALGMLFHSALDVTNTYGIMLLAPFSRRRFCTEWVFFIDAFVIAWTVPHLAFLAPAWAGRSHPASPAAAAVYAGGLAFYWTLKVGLRRRAARLAPEGVVSLLPSALLPWRFLGCARDGGAMRLFTLNAATGGVHEDGEVRLDDDAWRETLRGVPEFETLRELSPAYHVVEASRPDGADGPTRLVCRDLRTRNFRTRFGELEVTIDGDGAVLQKVFHV